MEDLAVIVTTRDGRITAIAIMILRRAALTIIYKIRYNRSIRKVATWVDRGIKVGHCQISGGVAGRQKSISITSNKSFSRD